MSPSASLNETQLSNGVLIPLIGMGTTHFGGYSHDTIVYGLRNVGYRMIDTAKRYGLETQLGTAIKESGVKRESLFLISKLWMTDFGYSSTIKACKASCTRLGTDYLVPLYMKGSQNEDEVRRESWRAMETLLDDGVCRSIGVSNFDETELTKLMDNCGVKPHINQIEFNPYHNPKPLREFCKMHDILFMVFDFDIPPKEMDILNGLHDGRKMVRLDNVLERLYLPDGYKL